MKKIILLVLVIVLSSCKTKKSVLRETKVETSDTLILARTTEKTVPVASKVIIRNIYDTITKRVVDYEQVFVVKNDTVKVTIKDNSLTLEIDQLEKTISDYKERLEAKHKEIQSNKEMVKTIYRWTKWTWIFLCWAIVATGLHFVSFGNVWGWFLKLFK